MLPQAAQPTFCNNARVNKAFVIPMAGLLAVLAACGGVAAPAASSPSAGAPAKPAGSAAASAASAGSAPASGGRFKMVAGYSVVSASQIQLWAPAEGGYFANEGLDVQVVKAGAGSVGLSALLSGDLNMLITSSTSTMNATVEGAPVVYVGSTMERLVQFMMARKDRADINGPKDMKGKKVGMTTPGSNSDVSAHLVAHEAGLEEGKDYTIVRMNDLPTIMGAVENGAIDLGMIDSAATAAKDLKVVADLTKVEVPISTIGFTTLRSYYEQHPNEMQAFARAYAAAVKRIKSDQAFTDKVLAKYLQIDDTSALHAIEAEFVPLLDDQLTTNKQNLENARLYAAYSLPKLQSFDVTKIEP
jgi:NitT/TauT family transport system substrate-binding protein